MQIEAATSGNETAPGGEVPAVDSFSLTLAKHGLELLRGATTTLQINVGLLCNQTCRHCHLEAGPGRLERMDAKTLDEVVAFAASNHFATIDITGGAPELHENLPVMLERLAPLTTRLMLRSNLTALAEGKKERLLNLCRERGVVMVASFPSLHEAQAEAQRGQGTFQGSLAALRRLNELGYGRPDSGLEINLVSNPTGAFLAASQAGAEKRFRHALEKNWGIVFNHLYTFNNVPLGRFRQWLRQTGNLDGYLRKLAAIFNPCAVAGVMCRSVLSVAWDGFVYDCDFNLARGIHLSGRKTHLSELSGPPDPGSPIAVSDHCYACTAGAGFT